MHIMENHFNINVARPVPDISSKSGHSMRHFFRVLVEDRIRAKEVLAMLVARFPVYEGYEITMAEWKGSGREIDIAEFLEVG